MPTPYACASFLTCTRDLYCAAICWHCNCGLVDPLLPVIGIVSVSSKVVVLPHIGTCAITNVRISLEILCCMVKPLELCKLAIPFELLEYFVHPHNSYTP